MAPRWQGQGLAREAVHELPALCFGQLQRHRVVAPLESAGLHREGNFRQNGWYTGE